MLATTVYTLVSQPRVLAKYRTALVMSSMVTFIAGYHYLRIFDSFKHASEGGKVLLDGSQDAFNEAYRYVDWLLTVPLLLVEVIAVHGVFIQSLTSSTSLVIKQHHHS